ncbi:MAG TPA: zf-HC2 domain-containing protein [Solirubrobacteraceae bacterium]|nr:zf-HC2 domain-containing protein [Solirubrobacteraceae bacterium]
MDDLDATRQALAISCADALELMTDHLEGALSAPDASRMRAHLESCQACSLFLDQLRATIKLVHDAGPPQEFAVDPRRLESLIELFRSERDN